MLGSSADTPREARRFLRAVLTLWGLSSGDSAWLAVADAELVLSELVTNAVRYGASGDIRVTLAAHRDQLTIRVGDGSPAMHHVPTPTGGEERGRGLVIVGALSTEWGVSPAGVGKQVWAHLAVPEGSALAHGCLRAARPDKR